MKITIKHNGTTVKLKGEDADMLFKIIQSADDADWGEGKPEESFEYQRAQFVFWLESKFDLED